MDPQYIHKKTGRIYSVLEFDAINATNANEGQRMVIYTKEKNIFVREHTEFHEKFVVDTLKNRKKYC